MRAVRERVAHGRFDLVYVEFTQMAHYVDCIGDIPAILDESDIAYIRRSRFAQTSESRTVRWVLKWDARKLTRYELGYCRRFRGILVRTEHDRRLLRSLVPDGSIEVFPPWVDLSFADRIEGEPIEGSLLFYGAMWRPANEQGVCYFANEILPRICDAGTPVRLTVLGSRPSERLYRMQGERICVTGYVPDVAPYYSHACVIVVPLLSGSGIKGKIIQGLACGKPVVTTSVGAEGIPATEHDGLFVRDDPGEFAECVRSLLEQRRYLRYRDAARRFVRGFYDWRAGVERLEKLCEIVANSGTGGGQERFS